MGYLDIIIGSDALSRALSVVLLASVILITHWTYNAFLHPLAKFPGPLHWRASRLPYMRAAWGTRFPYEIQRLHDQYGDVVRIAPNELSFTDPRAWDDIYSNTDGENSGAFKKSEIWHGNPSGGPNSVFNTIDFKEHARIRRFMDPAFSERAVSQQEPIIQDYVSICIKKLQERMSAQGKVTVNIVDWFNFTLFDIIGDLSFGESFGCLDKCEYESWMSQMADSIKLHYLSITLRWYPIFNSMLKPFAAFLVPKEIIVNHMDYIQRSTEKLKRRLSPEANIERPDIVSQLLRSEDRGEGLTPEEVVQNSMLFINAASETTATTLTAVANQLIQNPESLAALEDEIRKFSSGSDLSLQALKQLPYLNAVLQEALRLCNPNPIGHMRITPTTGGKVAGHWVPGNTIVTIQPMALALSPKHFHEPAAWHPERWLKEAESDVHSPYYHDQRKAVRGFGWGPYVCVGEPLGWAWMRLIIAKMVWTFDLKKANTTHSTIAWEAQDVYAIIIKHRLDVTFAERAA